MTSVNSITINLTNKMDGTTSMFIHTVKLNIITMVINGNTDTIGITIIV